MAACASATRPAALRASPRCHRVVASAAGPSGQPQAAPAPTRRAALAAAALAPLLQAAGARRAAADEQSAAPAAASKAGIEILDDQPGSGTAEAQRGDLLLVHYVGKVASTSALFDSTLGGQMYRDGGMGKLRPVLITLGGGPVPGICEGLQAGLEGMRVGGRRTVRVPASLGFGSGTVLGPYGVVPGGSELRYELQLLRLSRRGPDALMTGVSQCGGGFVMERSDGCADIAPAEFL